MTATRESAASLARIADALGVPVASFMGGARASDLSRRAELMRLWDAIPDDAGRDRLIALARELGAAPSERSGPATSDKLAAE